MKLAFRLSWLLIFVLGAAGGMLAMRLLSWEASDAARMARVARRSELTAVPPGFFDVAPLASKDKSGPAPVQEGQILVVEALESLPGRPITGERIVRADGTIGLGFYGDVPVAGLNRNQVKVRIIEHLRKYINDETLGLMAEQSDGTIKVIPPVESNRIFVDENIDYDRAAAKKGQNDIKALNARIDGLDAKLDRVLAELERSRPGQTPAASTSATPPAGTPPG